MLCDAKCDAVWYNLWEKEIIMQTLENLEQKFLSAVEIKPFELGDIHASINSDKKLSPEQSRHDIATLAQMFINVYGGWPFYPKLLRLRILNKLNRIYDKITHPITASELFTQLKPIIEIMPDNHLWIKLGDNLAKYPHSPRIDVGTNLAITHGNGKKYWIDKIGNVGVIAFSKCFAPDEKEDMNHFRKLVQNVMQETRAIIIDMRDNGGGSPLIMSMICDEIMGPIGIPRTKRMWSRTTSQAQGLYKYSTLSRYHIDKKIDPSMVADNTKFKLPTDYKPVYDRPIYILQNNKTASSAEHLQAQLRYHPQMQIVGSKSLGCMQYTNYQTLKLGHSGILIQLAGVYTEFFGIKHFETNGYEPDIKCPDGTDAFTIAITQIDTHKNTKKSNTKER